MAKVQYNGRADLRVLDAEDLKRHGVEGFKKTPFARGKSVQVTDEVAALFLDKPEVFGSFSLVDDEGNVLEKTSLKEAASADNEAPGATSQESTGTASTTTGTGSTSGSTSGRASTRTT